MGRLGVERATYLPVTELTHFLDHFLIYYDFHDFFFFLATQHGLWELSYSKGD